MKKYLLWCSMALLCGSISVSAQQPVIAPRDSVKALLNGKKISINYGKPSVRGRKIFGNVVKYYRVWRTGDGAATIFTTDVDLEMDGAIIPRGSYSLYTLPAEERWKLIINKQIGQWGTVYNPQLDLARVDLTVKPLNNTVEALTFKIEKNDNGNGMLKIEWENTQLSAPFHVNTEPVLPSPRDSVELMLNGKHLVVNYSRPSMRGRTIMGGVVSYNVVWRTGANAATSFTTTADLTAGNVKIPKGSYTLYTLPSSKQWYLIINKQTGQWGTTYNSKLDFVRLPLKKKTITNPVEQFTIVLERTGNSTGRLVLMWERTQLSLDFQ
ncbi:MAG TPA: DUF2911 domain-containing protein [Bacteroidota bacterium]|nr:DUF2911 domain-containing protein [Bacteroidota bacterium]